MTLDLSQFVGLPLTPRTLMAMRSHIESWRQWMRQQCGEVVPELHALTRGSDIQIVPWEHARQLLADGWREVERY